MDRLEVFADVSCPFAYVGLTAIVAAREEQGLHAPLLYVRPWPLELVNGSPLTGASLVPKIHALQRHVAPRLFVGFSPASFPATTLPVLAAEVAAHAIDPLTGERFSLAVRSALFEDGLDPSEPTVLDRLMTQHGVDPDQLDPNVVTAAWREGEDRGVVGSPYFFAGSSGSFCPSLTIDHDDEGYDISFDDAAFKRFTESIFDSRT